MSKAIKTVKTKKQLQALLVGVPDSFKGLLADWIDKDPIYVGTLTSADYKSSIQKHLIESTKHITIDGHWCEFGVREGRSLHWMIEE